MYSAAMSSPGEGVARPCRASDARKETSALRSAGAERAVERPIIVEGEEVSDGAISPPLGLAAADSLACVLDDFPLRRDGLLGIDPAPVNFGLADGKFKLSVSWIDRRFPDQNGCHD